MKKYYFALIAAAMGMCASAQDVTWHIVGTGINGQEIWSPADGPTFTAVEGQDGVLQLELESLSTGFKINDGSWTEEYDYGSPSAEAVLTLGEKFMMGNKVDTPSGNITFDGFTTVNNAVVTLDTKDFSVVVTGEPDGLIKWYFVGDCIAEGWTAGDGGLEMPREGSVISVVTDLFYNTEGTNYFKITNTGWGTQYGHGEFSADEINESCLQSELVVVGHSDEMNINLTGRYEISFDFDTKIVTFTSAAGVADVAVDANVAPVYYNLQGVRVNNLVEGNVYIAKRGNEAIKFVK